MERSLSLGNLNVTWGKEELPLLYFWSEIVWPGLEHAVKYKKRIPIRNNQDNILLIDRIKVEEIDDIQYLVGRLIRSTTIEISSQINEYGELVPANLVENSAPYSIFFVNLQNHRMGIVGSQKGAPTRANFKTMFEIVLKDYVISHNNKVQEKEERIPLPRVFLTNLPIAGSGIAESMKLSHRIVEVMFGLFPLNQEIPFDDTMAQMEKSRKSVGADKAKMVYTNPTDTDRMINAVDIVDNQGIAEIDVKIVDADGADQKITNRRKKNATEIKTKMPIEIDSIDDSKNVVKKMVDHIKKFGNASKSFFVTSPENDKIYKEKLEEIKEKSN